MKREQILDTLKSLAQSQGFYSRLYNSLCEVKNSNPDVYESVMQKLENQNFKDPVDVVMFFET